MWFDNTVTAMKKLKMITKVQLFTIDYSKHKNCLFWKPEPLKSENVFKYILNFCHVHS